MSGPVRRGSRSAPRSTYASPYARPASKKSSWSLYSFLNYFNPLRSRAQSQESSSGSEGSDNDSNRVAAAESLSSRGHQISDSLSTKNQQSPSPFDFARPPPASASSVSSLSPTNATFGHDVSPESPQKGLEYLSKYLGERPPEHPLSSVEAEELISLIKKSTPVEEHETFRFSSSTPSTPARGNSPLLTGTNSVPFSFSPSYVNAPSTPNSSPGKLLKQNPNGTYRWSGGGSAKPSRNRFHSPAFGPSPRSSRLVLRESPEKAAEPIKTDTKRRRVGEEASSSSPSPSGISTLVRSPGPAPSPTRAALASQHLPSPSPLPASRSAPNELKTPQMNGLKTSASTSRLRAPPKPTTPAVPSPLRQAWGQSSPTPSSKSSDDDPPSTQRATKTAAYMSELIKEVTPVRNLDVSNPYQVASPVKMNIKPKSKPMRKTRVSGKPSAPPETLTVNGRADEQKAKEKEKEKEKEVEERYSAQAIIEATLPKGSKRSRAPVNLGKGLPSSGRSPSPPKKSTIAPQIEEVEDDDEEERTSKKSKGNTFESITSIVNGHSQKASVSSTSTPPAPIIEEIDDEMTGAKPATKPSEVVEVGSGTGVNGTSKGSGSASSSASIPTFLASTSTRSPLFGASSSGQKISAIPKEPSKLRFSYKPEPTTPSESSLSSTGSERAAGVFSTLDSAKSSASGSSATEGSSGPSAFPRFGPKASKVTDPASAPTPLAAATLLVSPPASNGAVADPKEYARSLPITSLPVFSLDDTQPVASGSGLSNTKAMAAAKDFPQSKLPQFNFDAPMASISAMSTSSITGSQPPKAFNWTAAGIKAPDNASEWECSMCMHKNKDPSATKCSMCDADRPAAIQTPKTVAFDWAAAGMKKPGGDSGSGEAEWMCSMCMLMNPASAVSKCNVCDTLRPGASSAIPAASTSDSTPIQRTPVQKFDWAAAGLKAPETKAGVWTCANCGLENPEEATKCEICESSK